MKKILLAMSFICSLSVWAQTEIKTDIKSVTVSLNGAQVFRKGNISYGKGVNKIIIDNVSPSIRKEGIQASSNGTYRIMDVKHLLKYPEPLKVAPSIMPERIQKEIESLNDSIFLGELEKEKLNLNIETINNQKNIINKNRLVTGAGNSDTMPVLRELVDYYQKKLFELDDQLIKLRFNARKLDQRMTKMNTRLKDLNNFNQNTNQPVVPAKIIHQIEVTIYAEKSGAGDLEVNYLVEHAGWYPAYDLRVLETNQPIDFTYKAYIYQNTKEDWNNVPIKLISYDNRVSNSKPLLPTWYVQYLQEVLGKSKETAAYGDAYKVLSLSNVQMPTSLESKREMLNEDDAEEDFDFVANDKPNVSLALSNFAFDIAQAYTIKSDGKEVLVLVYDQKIEATYKHYLVPKIDTKAYLMANISDWESLNLISGRTNLYLDKTYLGNAMLNTLSLDDTMAIDLGVDPSIFCSRTKIHDAEKCKIIGNRRMQTITIEIVVKNNKNSEISLEIEDQIPVTIIEDIEVELTHDGKGSLDISTGKLKWDITLKAQEKKTFKFTYTIKYDKHRKII